MAIRPKTKPPRKTMYVPDSQRHTAKVTLRLDPMTAKRLRALATKRDLTMGEVIGLALDALEGRRS